MVLSKPPICIDLFSHYSYFSNQNVKCYTKFTVKMFFLFLFSSYYNSGTLYHVTWHICEPSKWSGIKNPQSQIKVTIQISVHYHVIALGVSLEAMQIGTDVTFCSKISGSQQKVKKYILPFQTWLHLNQSGGSTIIEFWGFGFWYSSCKWSDNFQTTHDFQCM